MSTTKQRPLDLFHEQNRYDGRDTDWPSDEVFKEPRRTMHNYWKKFHAAHDCGSDRVGFVEKTNSRPVGDAYEYRLYCWSCGYEVSEDDVLFIGGDWYSKHGWEHYGRPLEDLYIPEERVLELGPDPDRENLEYVLNIGRIEREGTGLIGFSFGNGTWYECDECGHETPLTYDGKCRMHYDGEWTERMQSDVEALAVAVRERNNSFVHRLGKHVDPLGAGDRAFEATVLWRRSTDDDTYPKLVCIDQVFKDVADDHYEYVLRDVEKTEMWVVDNEELVENFYDTGLDYPRGKDPLGVERVREVFENTQ